MEIPTEGCLCWDFFFDRSGGLWPPQQLARLTISFLYGAAEAGDLRSGALRGYLRYSASFATARARCDMPFLMSMPSCANDSS